MRNQIYLAGAITGIPWEKAVEWRNAVAKIVFDATYNRWHCFDPCDHFSDIDPMTDEQAMRYDLDALRHSRVMIVNMAHNPKSTGTTIEIGVAYENRIPIIVFNPESEELHPWIKAVATQICGDMDALLMCLCDHYLNEE